ncbi:hypothetical protein F7725_016686 [Dissostichus mawsoni]|uniref:Uncharacterized protein n=1 Tax=Dissostichus mawsoni TaxID=36200 RepID=A0A7J5Z366_DISMA|nr:hypothetical protein F7725_016686 [Dissostichus mawsoni]
MSQWHTDSLCSSHWLQVSLVGFYPRGQGHYLNGEVNVNLGMEDRGSSFPPRRRHTNSPDN